MSRVDFYILSQAQSETRLLQACRLAEHAAAQTRRVYVQTASTAEARQLDELLWSFRDGSFLPHEIYAGTAPSHTRVLVLLGDMPAPRSHRQLLINLRDALPEKLEDYEHIAEIVALDPEHKRLARERYKQYRERGCTLESHHL
ncbi:DNA polymerase III subunit chi [Steroidobacter denitrificans]|uniref:DNA polymerase III subunit chi n=1 Tax=Steroidobacter denitrificans TaxID=465721 RepID=A0A127F9U4_STEDE|nr:DNA polymerase III subunit chi [Steroidobacter denitrificans]AMN46329.1 DNA polymerase III subunit chi [Steroidobacter denitrificans]